MKVMTAQGGMTMKEMEEYIRTVTTKGQVTIPAEIRRLLEMEPGDKVVFRVRDDTVELQLTTMTLEDTFGAVIPRHQPEDFADLREIAIEEHAQKVVAEMKE
ncbi:MAG: AbrB/MazE/SpoVT family DNA-binding domain-containing protein [Anaerolineales bacterium]|jgi:antitoxin PrlF|nr:MAG: AbrB/MazE/SpoVT family DNA-binding domain-containing protein [Anaerolineales bacterium]